MAPAKRHPQPAQAPPTPTRRQPTDGNPLPAAEHRPPRRHRTPPGMAHGPRRSMRHPPRQAGAHSGLSSAEVETIRVGWSRSVLEHRLSSLSWSGLKLPTGGWTTGSAGASCTPPPPTLSPDTQLALVGLNPGGKRYVPPVASVEAGSAYRVESGWNARGERLQRQIQRLYAELSMQLDMRSPRLAHGHDFDGESVSISLA